jgi:hypothetical protein
MRKKPGCIKRLLSMNQHQKRWGARQHSAVHQNLAVLKTTIIEAGEPAQTRGSTKSLDAHLQNLRREFSGQSALLFYHAELIVLIRREHKVAETYQRFRQLWLEESEFLRENLNIRWLVSATDTFAGHDADMTVRAIGMMTTGLVNTVKMYESERYLRQTEEITLDQGRVADVQERLIPLFEGMSCFTVGTDDTLRNMVWSMEPFMEIKPTGPILREIWARLQTNDTVFSRFKNLHNRAKTSWWEES